MLRITLLHLLLCIYTYANMEAYTFYGMGNESCEFIQKSHRENKNDLNSNSLGFTPPNFIHLQTHMNYSSIFTNSLFYRPYYQPSPSDIGKAYRCVADTSGGSFVVKYSELAKLLDKSLIDRVDKGQGKWSLSIPYSLGYMGYYTYFTLNVLQLDSLAAYHRHDPQVKETYVIPESRFEDFQALYLTPRGGTARKEFLQQFSGRPDADSLGFWYYDSTGYGSYQAPDSTFAGGIVLNRIFFNPTEPWRVVKGLRYKVYNDLRVEILAEKIFLLYQYYQGDASCCGF